MNLVQTVAQSKNCVWQLANLTAHQKNRLLLSIALKLVEHKEQILQANQQDLALAQNTNLAPHLLARLSLSEAQLRAIISSIKDTVQLDDPVGKTLHRRQLASGLQLQKITVPLGVIAVIYESRPNVTVDVVTLALKAGNAVVLRGGKEAINTNKAMLAAIHQALEEHNLPVELVNLISDTERQVVTELLTLHQYIDLLIPRGGSALQQLCIEQATMPIITGGIGVCHIYIDAQVEQDLAIKLIDNAKTQSPSVCNAVETILVNQAISAEFLPRLAAYLAAKKVVFHADAASFAILEKVTANVVALQASNLDREWLSLDLNVCIVTDLTQAVEHIRQHGTGHSEVILSNNVATANQFVSLVDAAAVYINASSRFTDGGQFGLGCEVAVSTQKVHARGPLGLESLVTYKWVGIGDYLVRS